MKLTPVIVCRPALPSDAADVLEFTKFIWNGHDYIKYVWTDWLADPRGILAAAQYGRRTVAIGKVTYLSEGQWWLEGVRVDPQYQGLKIGSHIFDYLEDWWLAKGGGTLRWMTSSERVQMHHLAARSGHTKIGEVRSYSARADAVGGDAFRSVEPAEANPALAFASAHIVHSFGLMDWGWKFSAPDEPVLAMLASERRLYWWRDRAALLGTWEEEDDDGGKVLGLSFIACELPALADILAGVRGLAASLGYARLVWLAPVQGKVERYLKQAGFETDWDGTGFLFEKRDSDQPPK